MTKKSKKTQSTPIFNANFLDERFKLTEIWEILLEQELAGIVRGGDSPGSKKASAWTQLEVMPKNNLTCDNMSENDEKKTKSGKFFTSVANKLSDNEPEEYYNGSKYLAQGQLPYDVGNLSTFFTEDPQELELMRVFSENLDASFGKVLRKNPNLSDLHSTLAPEPNHSSFANNMHDIIKNHYYKEREVDFSANNGLSYKKIRRIQGGRHSIDAVLDLHGFTLAEAEHVFSAFVLQNYADKNRFLLIITGKGAKKPYDLSNKQTMQGQLWRWIQQSELADKVIRCSSAHHKHGGNGAFYLLLRAHS